MLGVPLGLAPIERDAVGVAVTVAELDGVLETLIDGVALADIVCEAEGVFVGDAEPEAVIEGVASAERLGVAGALGLELGLARRERDDVGVAVLDALRLNEAERVEEALAVGVCVGLAVPVRVGVRALVTEAAPLSVALTLGLGESLAVRDAL